MTTKQIRTKIVEVINGVKQEVDFKMLDTIIRLLEMLTALNYIEISRIVDEDLLTIIFEKENCTPLKLTLNTELHKGKLEIVK